MQVGDAYVWVPYGFDEEWEYRFPDDHGEPLPVKGQITYINEAHRYFTVAGMVNGQAIRESFKF